MNSLQKYSNAKYIKFIKIHYICWFKNLFCTLKFCLIMDLVFQIMRSSFRFVIQWGHGCFSDVMGLQICVYFSPFSTHRKGSQKVNQDHCLLLIITSIWPDQPCLPRLLKMSVQIFTTPTNDQRYAGRSNKIIGFTCHAEFTATSGQEKLK